jgi:hypothetical protein
MVDLHIIHLLIFNYITIEDCKTMFMLSSKTYTKHICITNKEAYGTVSVNYGANVPLWKTFTSFVGPGAMIAVGK